MLKIAPNESPSTAKRVMENSLYRSKLNSSFFNVYLEEKKEVSRSSEERVTDSLVRCSERGERFD